MRETVAAAISAAGGVLVGDEGEAAAAATAAPGEMFADDCGVWPRGV